jgi:hypothetical protein
MDLADPVRRLPALFGDTGLDSCQRLFFTQESSQFIAFAIIPLCHIGSLSSLRDHCVLDRDILLFCLYVVGCKCYS